MKIMSNILKFKIFGIYVWYSVSEDGFGWFRFFGFGLKWKDITKHEYTFSERNGYSKGFFLWKWRIGVL